MSKVTYPRPCPTCGTKINNLFNFSRHKKYCGKQNEPVPCLYCDKVFSLKDNLIAHVRKFHSEAAKRKAEESAELQRMKLLHGGKVPRLVEESQTGGVVTTRGMKRESDQETKIKVKLQESNDVKDTKEEPKDKEPTSLFVAKVTKLGPAKRWKQNVVVNQKFMMSLDQQRPSSVDEDLNIGALFAIADATDKLIEELKIHYDYWMTLQIGSKEHQKEGLSGETWKIPVGDFMKRVEMTQTLLMNLSSVLNSGEFITRGVGFSASVLFSRPERKGGKTAGADQIK